MICYFHNLQYDLGNIFEDLDVYNVNMVGSRIIKATWKEIEFRDSFNIWPMALAVLAKAFGKEKLKFDANSKEYVFGDVEILDAAMRFAWEFARTFGVELPSTLGSFAVEVFHSIGLKNWRCVNRFAHEGFYGGRVELFSTGGFGPILYTDINSLYPWAMTQEFPTECIVLPDWKEGWGVAEVDIDIPKLPIAPLPFRTDTGEIMYPVGKVRGVWTFHEIRNAERLGAVVQHCYGAMGSLKAFAYYKPYVEKLYALRLAAKTDAEKLMLKLLLNNLYGQLANRGVVTKSFDRHKSNKTGICYGSKIFVDVEIPPPDFANYLHGAYVTAYGRLRWMEYGAKIPAKRRIYGDTDAHIFFHNDEEEPFHLGSELGEMKLEKFFLWFEALGPKMYAGEPMSAEELAGMSFAEKIRACRKAVEKARKFTRPKMVRGGLEKVEVGKPKDATLYDPEAEKKDKAIYLAKGVPKRKARDYILKGSAEYETPYKMREAIHFYEDEESGKIVNKRKLSVWRKIVKNNQKIYTKKNLRGNLFYDPIKLGQDGREASSPRDTTLE